MGPGRQHARRQLGYTLVELMIIVTIIGISITAFAPGFGRAMADRRVSNAARELIRLGRRARSDTFGLLRAHTLWLQPANGTAQLLRAPTNSCLLTVWADCAASPQTCVENVSLTGASARVAYREELVSGAIGSANRAICFAPSGIVYFNPATQTTVAAAAATFSDQNTVNGGLVYALYPSNMDPTKPTTRMHRVLFPLGATPRALR